MLTTALDKSQHDLNMDIGFGPNGVMDLSLDNLLV